MDYDEILLTAEEAMGQAQEHFKQELRGIRTGRATPALLDPVRVDYYGALTALKQLATISVPDPTLLLVKPFDPSSLKDIEKAILKAELGLNPRNDGKVIRVTVPPLSEERRKQFVATAKEVAERARVSIRNARRDANRQGDLAEKEKLISEDDKHRLRDSVQKSTDGHEKQITELLEKKTADLMQV